MVIAAFLLFDQLVRLEYKAHRGSWEADGQPHGFFWVPPESKLLGGWMMKLSSGIASKRCSLVWLFSTPEWVRRDERAGYFLFWYRLVALAWNVGILGIAATMLIR